jgi:hypothetical protein
MTTVRPAVHVNLPRGPVVTDDVAVEVIDELCVAVPDILPVEDTVLEADSVSDVVAVEDCVYDTLEVADADIVEVPEVVNVDVPLTDTVVDAVLLTDDDAVCDAVLVWVLEGEVTSHPQNEPASCRLMSSHRASAYLAASAVVEPCINKIPP